MVCKILEIRVGMPIPCEETQAVKPSWLSTPFSSGYIKHKVPAVDITTDKGLCGNDAGFPTHIDDIINRAALVVNEMTLEHLKSEFPECVSTLNRGGFGETFVVNHSSFLPSVVCVGDVYRIGAVLFQVTGPRKPCPKVDSWHETIGLMQYTLENGCAGIFMRVLSDGTCYEGDEIKLINRPYPDFSIQRISQGLWGKENVRENNCEFYESIASITCLIGRGYRDVAMLRLREFEKAKTRQRHKIIVTYVFIYCFISFIWFSYYA